MKKYLLPLLLASKLLAGDSTNAPNLQMSTPTNVIVNQSATARLYSLEQKTNLLEETWLEISQTRGNGSNLVIEAENNSPQKFYRVNAIYSPLEPTLISIGYSDGQHGGACNGGTTYYDINCYANSNLEVLVDFIPAISVGGYVSNMPFYQTFTQGINNISVFIQLTGCNQRTVFTSGNIIISENSELNKQEVKK